PSHSRNKPPISHLAKNGRSARPTSLAGTVWLGDPARTRTTALQPSRRAGTCRRATSPSNSAAQGAQHSNRKSLPRHRIHLTSFGTTVEKYFDSTWKRRGCHRDSKRLLGSAKDQS